MSSPKVFFDTRGGSFRARYVDEHGKRREKAVVRPSSQTKRAMRAARREAERRLEQIIDQVEQRRAVLADPVAAAAGTPIDEHVLEYGKFLEAGASSPAWRKKSLFRVRALLDAADITALEYADVARVDRALLQLKDAGKSESSRKHYRDALLAFGKWLVTRNRALTNPFADTVKIRTAGDPGRKRRGWFDDAEVVALIGGAEVRGLQQYRRTHPTAKADTLAAIAAKGAERAAIYRFAIATALRADEIRELRWGQVSIAGDRITLRLLAENTKSARDDRVTLTAPELGAELTQRRKEQTAQSGRVDGASRVFSVPVHIRRRMYEDMAFAELPRVDERGRHRDFHALRHTAARRWILACASPKFVQRLMRHSDIRLTFDLYADLEMDELLDAAPVEAPRVREVENG